MKINEVAAMTGLSVRALHHYDKIRLLCPSRHENGYREYSGADLDRLQQILFFRECGFSLEKTGELLDCPSFELEQALELQKKCLLRERERINAMLKTLEKTIKAAKGELIMSQNEKFEGFDFSTNPYEEEARSLWGDEAVDESKARLGAMPAREQNAVGMEMDSLFRELSALRHEYPASKPAQDAIDKMYAYFNKSFCQYTLESFAGLGRMYVEDSRFTKNIDKYGEGLSAFLMAAMDIYAKNHS